MSFSIRKSKYRLPLLGKLNLLIEHEAQRLAILRGDLTDFQLPSPPSHDRFQIYSYMAEFTNPTKVRLQITPHG